jgi:hypothetical protein
MHRVKLLAQRLAARDFDRQVAEVHVRVAMLNGFTALGSPSRKPWDESVRGKGTLGHQAICATEPGSAPSSARCKGGRRSSGRAFPLWRRSSSSRLSPGVWAGSRRTSCDGHSSALPASAVCGAGGPHGDAFRVFLIDMSGLTGLLRAASFLGLGLTPIAIGRVYQRFVLAPRSCENAGRSAEGVRSQRRSVQGLRSRSPPARERPSKAAGQRLPSLVRDMMPAVVPSS